MMTKWTRGAACLGLLAALGACGGGASTGDTDATGYQASVWTDPDGCKHWVIDDGAEGFMSPILHPDGKPDCG